MRHLWYGLGLIAAVGMLVAIQVVPKLEQYNLRTRTQEMNAADYGGAKWRLIEFGPSRGRVEKDTKAMAAVIGVTPLAEAGSKALREGCEASVRDARNRVWVSSEVGCNRAGEDRKPIVVPPGKELRWTATFTVPEDAVSSLRVEARLARDLDFVRLAR